MTIRFRALLICLLTSMGPVVAQPPVAPPLLLAEVYEGAVDVDEYWVSEKLDGVRGRWTGSELLTRRGNRINVPAWFVEGWPSVPLDGELWIARGRFDEASGIVRQHDAVDADWRRMRFMVFDLPDEDAPFEQRLQRLNELLARTGIDWLQPVEQFRVADVQELDQRLDEIVAAGGEGLMLHHRDARYHAGRSNKLLKYKRHEDAEARVIGHTEGTGKYAGMLGALVVEDAMGRRFRVGSGFSDAERADPPPLGSCITYRYNGRTSNGLPRFARYLRLRPDHPCK